MVLSEKRLRPIEKSKESKVIHKKGSGRLHERCGTSGGHEAERIIMASLHEHERSEHKVRKTGTHRAAHKVGGQVREEHSFGSFVRGVGKVGKGIYGVAKKVAPIASPFIKMANPMAGAALGALGLKKGGRVTEKHMHALANNPELLRHLKARHKELSRSGGGHHEEREHHFLGSLIRGVKGAAKGAYGMAKKAAASPFGSSMMKMAAPHAGAMLRKGMDAASAKFGPKVPSSVKNAARAAAPLAKMGVGMMEAHSPEFAKGMGKARAGASAMGFKPSFKTGGKVRSKHAAGAIAKHRLDQY